MRTLPHPSIGCILLAALLTTGRAALSDFSFAKRVATLGFGDFTAQLVDYKDDMAVNGPYTREVNIATNPILEQLQMSSAITVLPPCSISPPHIHPRSSEIIYVINGGSIEVGFVQSVAGQRKVVSNPISLGHITVIPRAHIHYIVNGGCTPATILSGYGSGDPGYIPMVNALFGGDNLPPQYRDMLGASFGLTPPAVNRTAKASGTAMYTDRAGGMASLKIQEGGSDACWQRCANADPCTSNSCNASSEECMPDYDWLPGATQGAVTRPYKCVCRVGFVTVGGNCVAGGL
eukprot:GDKI01028406.1.p1 GENE.GDKI01028406.1~~GDKI01028406.1.p1  ORF type:complete len:291 (+),score=36.81 GDKI01028406.1:79-951(+)